MAIATVAIWETLDFDNAVRVFSLYLFYGIFEQTLKGQGTRTGDECDLVDHALIVAEDFC